MASPSQSRSRRNSETSDVLSPTDARTPTRFDPGSSSARDYGLSESFQSTDTVRRRPEASYGTMQSPTPAAPSSSQLLSEPFAPDRPQGGSRASASQSVTRSPMLGPERGRGHPRKPPMTRRASSNAQAPHRGEIFSVDDATDEVEADHAQRHGSYSHSTARRRTVAPPALSRVHSRQEDVEEIPDEEEDQSQKMPTRPGSSSRGGHAELGEGALPSEEVLGEEDEDQPGDGADDPGDDEDDDGDISDAESFTLKDRQQAINETHPFGIRLWKPALYKKDRSVQKTAEGDIHSTPGGRVSNWLFVFNFIWTLCFGWWMAGIAFAGAIVCFLFAAAPSGRQYGRVLWGLAGYLFYPFGKFIRLEQQEAYLDEDQGEGRSISEYEQWQSGDLEYGRLFFGPERGRSIVGRSRRSIDSGHSETDSLLGRGSRRSGGGIDRSDSDVPPLKRRLFGRGQWNIGRVIFFLFFYLLLTPSLFIVSGICWFLVFWIPMGKVTMLLIDHLRRHPLALNFGSGISAARAPTAPHSSIIVCTYRAVGLKYWKYTIDGTNIFLINLMAVVFFVVFDWMVIDGVFHYEGFITSEAFLFVAGLLSIIPLAYFIGQAVASISAQSSMGVGAAINAFFSTVVEVFLYCVALSQGKGQLVEGSIVGSIFAGILFLPGLSMCFGAIKRKTQRFNARSAGVTSTMLLFAVIGAFGPTLFYQIYGTHELNCLDCINFEVPSAGGGNGDNPKARDCRRCYFSQTPALDDRFYLGVVRPYCYMAAALLFLSYIIGLWFTLRTHAAVIWNTDVDEKKHEDHGVVTGAAGYHTGATSRSGMPSIADTTGADIRDTTVYKRILGQSLRQAGLAPQDSASSSATAAAATGARGAGGNGSISTPHLVPPKGGSGTQMHIPGFSEAENTLLAHQVAEIAATAAAAAVIPRRSSTRNLHGSARTTPNPTPGPRPVATFPDNEDPLDPLATPHVGGHAPAGSFPVGSAVMHGADAGAGGGGHGGHDAPNWGRLKSSVILLGATVLYAIIAEILVDSVDFVLEGYAIDEKFVGISLFALVPNTTEFLNAISFAMNGNIALSMEIGSAYALQVCLLQIPALVLYSAVYAPPAGVGEDLSHYTFSLLFPQWDMVTVILCVFLLSYMYGEGKSNYFKGSILLLSYLVVIVGFWCSGFTNGMDDAARRGAAVSSRFDRMAADGSYVSYGSDSFRTIGRGKSGLAF